MWKQLLLFLGMQPEAVCCAGSQPKKVCVPKPPNCSPVKKECAWEPPALILENYQLRRWLFLGAGRLGDDAILWGKRIINRSQLSGNAQAGVSQLLTTPDPFHDPFSGLQQQVHYFCATGLWRVRPEETRADQFAGSGKARAHAVPRSSM